MRRMWVDLALLGALAACGSGGGTGPDNKEPPPLTIAAALPNTGMVAGTSVQATVTTSTGGAVTGAIWRSTDSKVAFVTDQGLITAHNVGYAKITARSGTVEGALDINVVPGAPVAVKIYVGDGQVAPRNSALGDPLCTNVVDSEGNWIIGVNVTYAVATGGGSIGPAAIPKTDSRGISTSGTWVLGPDVGQQTVIATADGGFTVTFKATAQ